MERSYFCNICNFYSEYSFYIMVLICRNFCLIPRSVHESFWASRYRGLEYQEYSPAFQCQWNFEIIHILSWNGSYIYLWQIWGNPLRIEELNPLFLFLCLSFGLNNQYKTAFLAWKDYEDCQIQTKFFLKFPVNVLFFDCKNLMA